MERSLLRLRGQQRVPLGSNVRFAHRGACWWTWRSYQLLSGSRLLRGADEPAGGFSWPRTCAYGHVHRVGYLVFQIQTSQTQRTSRVILVTRQHSKSMLFYPLRLSTTSRFYFTLMWKVTNLWNAFLGSSCSWTSSFVVWAGLPLRQVRRIR